MRARFECARCPGAFGEEAASNQSEQLPPPTDELVDCEPKQKKQKHCDGLYMPQHPGLLFASLVYQPEMGRATRRIWHVNKTRFGAYKARFLRAWRGAADARRHKRAEMKTQNC